MKTAFREQVWLSTTYRASLLSSLSTEVTHCALAMYRSKTSMQQSKHCCKGSSPFFHNTPSPLFSYKTDVYIHIEENTEPKININLKSQKMRLFMTQHFWCIQPLRQHRGIQDCRQGQSVPSCYSPPFLTARQRHVE